MGASAETVLEKLARAADQGDIVIFSQHEAERLQEVATLGPEDILVLRQMIYAWRGLGALRMGAGLVKSAVIWIGLIAATIGYFESRISLKAFFWRLFQ